ncbi:anti-sigma factor [uncultured Paenibacillus sp.]|uniref:anti-sigma factor n=1 Tax=uncultured Paenibacillus sp. TaxID=227322 RepID=UPI0015AFD8E0|nr:anti-sigma factor [uncultured Paenibacillus sp.]
MNGQAGDSFRKIGGAEHKSVCIRMYSEQEWIDWLLGTLTEAKRSEMAKHLDTCTVCLEQTTYWENVLGIGGENELLSDMSTMPAAGEPGPAQVMTAHPELAEPPLLKQAAPPSALHHHLWTDAVPSERIRRSLRRRVRRIGWRRRAMRLLTVRWKWTVSLAAALMVLVGMGVAMDRLNQPEATWDRYVQTYEPEALPVLSKPDTISYPIAMGRLEPENGRVWYNAATREMLMLVGGLVPEKGQTIRVWIVKEGARDSLGLLQYHANRAHLYVKDKTLNVDDDLELTIEPAGGAPDVNMVPNSILLDLLGR